MQRIIVANTVSAAIVEARVADGTTETIVAGSGRVGLRRALNPARSAVVLVSLKVDACFTARGQSWRAVRYAVCVAANLAYSAGPSTLTAVGGITLDLSWHADFASTTATGILASRLVASTCAANADLPGGARLLARSTMPRISLEVDAATAAIGEPAAASQHASPRLAGVACAACTTAAAASVIPADLTCTRGSAAVPTQADSARTGRSIG
jgi:hypothetical protein